MKPVLVLQHMHLDGPAYLGQWLREQEVPYVLRNTEAGEDFPARIDGYRALAVLGGEMSANDELPSLRQAQSLIRQAFDLDIPVLGHCLGGQLMARALGARVSASPAPEVGWQPITVHDNPLAKEWFGAAGPTTVFHWHFEAFDLPAGASPLASSEACPHQAFAFGPHLAMQFHVEIDEAKLHTWATPAADARLAPVRQHASVQGSEAMLAGAKVQLASHQRLAARMYRHWMTAQAGR
jgi:GMP synthase-like glutamine amidotransferase